MSQQLSFIGKLDRREESLAMTGLQEQAFVDRLLGHRDRRLIRKLYRQKRVRDVYTPPTRGVDGSSVVMSKN